MSGSHACTSLVDKDMPALDCNSGTHTYTYTLFGTHGRASSAAVQRKSSRGARSNREKGDRSVVDSKPPSGR
eukprot:1917220-Alexandrium_andersonii.AAC.1